MDDTHLTALIRSLPPPPGPPPEMRARVMAAVISEIERRRHTSRRRWHAFAVAIALEFAAWRAWERAWR